MRELIIKWLREGLKLESGEEIYIPTDSKPNQSDMYNLLRKELAVMRQIDVSDASKLRISTTYKDSQFWVVIKKISLTPLVAFKKDIDGTVSRLTLTHDKHQERLQMLKEADHGKAAA